MAAAAPAADDAAECAVIADAGQPISTVALSERVDPANAPRPTNDSERLLFRQLYETLVRVDCAGRVQPGLAAAWRLDADGGMWIVTLRDDARFSDGTPVTTADVLSSWTSGPSGDLSPPVSRYVQSIVPVDERAIAIALRDGGTRAPMVLAHTSLAIARRSPDSPWPLGTRDARVVPGQGASDPGARAVITIAGAARRGTVLDAESNPWSVRFIVAPDRDRRDFLDEGVDLLLTRDPATLGYAATLPQLLLVPLAWQRTHVFLSPWRERSLPQLSPEARQALAVDAIRGEARGAEAPFWWQEISGCELPEHRPPGRPMPTTGRIAYERGDEASRDLAERFVGLASIASAGAPELPSGQGAAILAALLPGAPRQTYQRAISMTGDPWATALERGTDAGYVVSFDRRPLDPCQALRAVVNRLGWVDPEAIVPLVDTRLQAIARRGRSGLTAEWDGGLLLARE